jgi:hypothetical protein
MPWVIAALVLGGLYLYSRSASGAAQLASLLGSAVKSLPASTTPAAPGSAITTLNVAPFVTGAPVAKFNLDASQFPATLTMKVGDTLTITAALTGASVGGLPGVYEHFISSDSGVMEGASPPPKPWSVYGWTPTVSSSAVTYAGLKHPGLPAPALNSPHTETYGYVAAAPGIAQLFLAPVSGPTPGTPVLAATITVT